MNRLDLIDALSSADEEEVLIDIDGVLYEIDENIGHEEQKFDGFDTLYPAAIVLKVKDE